MQLTIFLSPFLNTQKGRQPFGTKLQLMRALFKRPGVTRQLLWQEYLGKQPDGLKYTQFCYHFQKWQDDERISMHIDHKAGDKMFVDYTGQTMTVTDRKTGRQTAVQVFVAILPASQLTYVEASSSQNQESFVRSNERALRYFGGAPAAIVPDNLKAGVLKANIYEPDLNPLFADFAEFYRTAVLPARARKPKDKAHVENAVKIIYNRVFAPLRNETFYSLDDLNLAIRERLEDHNTRKLSKMSVSRRELFDQVEQKELQTLPTERFPIKSIQNNTLVQFNYHVLLKEDQHYYSVPYRLRKQRVRVMYDDRSVSIYHDNIRIALHMRHRTAGKYTTVKDHMPAKHRFDDNWDPDKLKSWAASIGRDTANAVTYLLDKASHPEQAYKSCMGIMALAKKYGAEVLNMACLKAGNLEQTNYRFIERAANEIASQYENREDLTQLSLLPQLHENVRGGRYYGTEEQT
jgi:transposase